MADLTLTLRCNTIENNELDAAVIGLSANEGDSVNNAHWSNLEGLPQYAKLFFTITNMELLGLFEEGATYTVDITKVVV